MILMILNDGNDGSNYNEQGPKNQAWDWATVLTIYVFHITLMFRSFFSDFPISKVHVDFYSKIFQLKGSYVKTVIIGPISGAALEVKLSVRIIAN